MRLVKNAKKKGIGPKKKSSMPMRILKFLFIIVLPFGLLIWGIVAGIKYMKRKRDEKIAAENASKTEEGAKVKEMTAVS